MKSTLAVLFPGQGSQSVGMMQSYVEYPVVRDTFSVASDCLGYDLWKLVDNGPENQLNQTAYTQPALLTANIAIWRVFSEKSGLVPCAVAGHSLGEYAALVAASVLSFEDALNLVAMRGQLMQKAVPEGAGAMAAIIGLDDAAVDAVCKDASVVGPVSAANYNSVGQVVIAGAVDAVEQAMVLAKQAGARMAKQIPVSVPSHCVLMQPAAEAMRKELEATPMQPPQFPVFQNVNADMTTDIALIRQSLIDQLVSPVQWVKTIQRMVKEGASIFLECGPGNVLTGLNKRIDKALVTMPLKECDGIDAAIQML